MNNQEYTEYRKYLNTKVDTYTRESYPRMVKKTRSEVYARQGLNDAETREMFFIDVKWKN